MKHSKADQKKIVRLACWGGGILGFAGFATGVVLCLIYRLPIPPLFITELGVLLGGCLGALCAITGTEKKVAPTLVALAGALALGLGLDLEWGQLTLALAGAAGTTWALADAPERPGRAWKNI